MHSIPLKSLLLAIPTGLALLAMSAITVAGSPTRKPGVRPGATSASSNLPLSFEPNQGQSKEGVQFVARGPGYVLYLNERGSSFQFSSATKMSEGQTNPLFGLSLAGSKKPQTNMRGVDEQPSKSSYYIGPDPKKWVREIPNFRKVEWRGVYEGIDATYRGSQGELECEFKVAPHANPGNINLEIVGAKDLHRDAEGDIVFTITHAEMRLHRPAAYQELAGASRSAVSSSYMLKGNIVTVRIGPYDPNKHLFIIPVLSYSGLLKLQGGRSLPQKLFLDHSLSASRTSASRYVAFHNSATQQPSTKNIQEHYAFSHSD